MTTIQSLPDHIVFQVIGAITSRNHFERARKIIMEESLNT